MKTKSEALAYLKSMEGKRFNPDNAYGFQCVDTANQWWLYLFGHTLKGVGAADIPAVSYTHLTLPTSNPV